MMKKILNMMKDKGVAKRGATILTALMIGAGCFYGSEWKLNSEVPELTTVVDQSLDGVISIAEDEVPLGNTKVTTKKSTKTSKKTVKLKTAAKKTYNKKSTKTKTNTKTTKKVNEVIKVETKTVTTITEQFKKKAKKKTVVTKVVTTTKTTTTTFSGTTNTKATASNGTTPAGSNANLNQTVSSGTKNNTPYTVSTDSIVPKADEKVRKAFDTLGFEFTINPTVSYAGYFNARNQEIILKQQDNTGYHELGHFVAFVAGNVDTKSAFVSIYQAEKSKYTGTNKAYVTQSSSEYFAESYKDYVLNPGSLKSSRPETYEYIDSALDKITDSYVARIKAIYSSVWK